MGFRTILTLWQLVCVIVCAVAAQCHAVQAKDVAPLGVIRPSEIGSWCCSEESIFSLYENGTLIQTKFSDHSHGSSMRFPPAGTYRGGQVVYDTGSDSIALLLGNGVGHKTSVYILSAHTLETKTTYVIAYSWDLGSRVDCLDLQKSTICISCPGYTCDFDLRTGDALWQARRKSRDAATRPVPDFPVLRRPDDDQYYVISDGSKKLVSKTGAILSQFRFGGLDWYRPKYFTNCPLVTVIQSDPSDAFVAIQNATGEELWRGSPAGLGSIEAISPDGHLQIFRKGNDYTGRFLPGVDSTSFRLTCNEEVQFSPSGRFIVALPKLQFATPVSSAGTVEMFRTNRDVTIVDVAKWKLVEPFGLLP